MSQAALDGLSLEHVRFDRQLSLLTAPKIYFDGFSTCVEGLARNLNAYARLIDEYCAGGLCYIEEKDKLMAFTGRFRLSSVLRLQASVNAYSDAESCSLNGGLQQRHGHAVAR